MGLVERWRRWRRERQVASLLAKRDLEAVSEAVGDDVALRRELADRLLEAGDLAGSRALMGKDSVTVSSLLAATPADPELDRLKAEAAAQGLPVARVVSLADALVERGDAKASLALLEREAHRGEWPLIRKALEALIEAEQWDRAWSVVEEGFTCVASQKLRGTPEHEFLLLAHRTVLSALENAEAVTVDLLVRGELDPFSGANHLLLAKALMLKGPLATRLELVPAPQELREGEGQLRLERSSATGLMLVGSAKLRLGELDAALAAFERGRDVAPRHFALVAGLGAARRLGVSRHLDRISRLPKLEEPARLLKVVPDLESFTALERRVIVASVEPFARWVPALIDSASRLRVLPLDVRVTDLPEFEELKGRVESRDHRSWDAIGGLAGDGLGCVRVEELFDLDELSWTFAHEFAHLVHAVLPEALVQMLHAEWERACEHEFAFDQYQLHNEYEFFAVTYTRWLARRYGTGLEHEQDEEGHLARALKCIDRVREGS